MTNRNIERVDVERQQQEKQRGQNRRQIEEKSIDFVGHWCAIYVEGAKRVNAASGRFRQ
jgi:hypothetical protein